MTSLKIYTVPVDDQSRHSAKLVAATVEELLVLINEERIDIENNYLYTEDMLASMLV
jgi:hypothetical protein